VGSTIFFSWQNDRLPLTGRNFIERALKDALRRINADATVENAPRGELLVDRDTLNTPGSPPIFETILEKIEAAIIFVPDLTFVGARDGGAPVPNPNVLIEYGYALNQHGHERIIGIMNDAYGEPAPENMPFNLGHIRFPIRYTLHEDASEEGRKNARAVLSRQLESAIRLVLDNASAEPEPTPRPRTVLDEAEDLVSEREFQTALSALGYGIGLEKVRSTVQMLFAGIRAHCAQLHSRIEVECEAKPWGERDIDNYCWVRSKPYAVQVYWRQPYGGSGRDAVLLITMFKGPIILPSEMGRLMALDQPSKLSTKTFVPYLSRESDVGWAEKKSDMRGAIFISNAELIDVCLTDFIRLLKSASERGPREESHRQRQPPRRPPGSPWS
jgi:hypothetical protein